jgi:hypothetical protein
MNWWLLTLFTAFFIAGVVVMILYWDEDNWKFWTAVGAAAVGLVGVIACIVHHKYYSKNLSDESTPSILNFPGLPGLPGLPDMSPLESFDKDLKTFLTNIDTYKTFVLNGNTNSAQQVWNLLTISIKTIREKYKRLTSSLDQSLSAEIHEKMRLFLQDVRDKFAQIRHDLDNVPNNTQNLPDTNIFFAQ